MQVRRQPPADESSFGRPLPKAVQNSPYASVMAPGLHKKIARGKASSRTSSTNNQRQPRLSRDISDVDHLGKLGSPTSHHNGIPNELFAPSSNQNEVCSILHVFFFTKTQFLIVILLYKDPCATLPSVCGGYGDPRRSGGLPEHNCSEVQQYRCAPSLPHCEGIDWGAVRVSS